MGEHDVFVVDFGFSSVKWLSGESRGRLTSAYRKTRRGDGYLFHGERFLVGDKALNETGSSYIRTVNELIEFYPLFTACAAEAAGIERAEILAVGLPHEYWDVETGKARRNNRDNAIEALKQSLAKIEVNDRSCAFQDILVFPQGVGGIKIALERNPGLTGNILGIDIGFNTVIYNLYSPEKDEILIGRTFYKKGLHDMAVNLLMPEIMRHTAGKTLTPIELNHIIESRTIQVGIEPVDLSPEIEMVSREYIEELLTLIIGDLKAHGGVISFNAIAVFGGGARLLAGQLKAEKIKVIISEEPEYDNVEGFGLKALELKQRLGA